MIRTTALAASIAALLAQSSAASELCFESDKIAVAGRTDWSHHHYVVNFEKRPSPGAVYRQIYGYGWDDAQGPNGEPDIVPFTGSAVFANGEWRVSITGTLAQFTELDQSGGQLSYYAITEHWRMRDDLSSGLALIGNLSRPFMVDRLPGSRDDYFESDIYRVSCNR